ncbi:MAG: tetratricopeptide repeat protein [Anaerolineae bacterium]|nr:tetratricopeptide repeat protein [Anaerolineae bacterium]
MTVQVLIYLLVAGIVVGMSLPRAMYAQAEATPDTEATAEAAAWALYQQGVDAYWDARYEDSIRILDTLIATNPDFIEAYAYRSTSYRVLGDLEAALEDIHKALELDPDHPLALSMYARWQSDNGNFEEGLRLASRAIELAPEESIFYFNRARVYGDFYFHNEALVDLEQAIILGQMQEGGPRVGYVEIYGWNLYSLGRYWEAVSYYKYVLEIVPTRLTAIYTLVNLYILLGQYPEAMSLAERHIELDPNDPRGYNLKGRVWDALGNIEAALEEFTRATEVDPSYMTGFSNIALQYFRMGDYVTALEKYTYALSLEGHKDDLAGVYFERGIVNGSLGYVEDAIADYTKAIEYIPTFHEAYLNRGNLWRGEREYDLAIADYEEAIRIFPQFWFAYWNMGIAYSEMGNEGQAIRQYQISLSINPRYADTYNSLGISYLRIKEYKLAVEAFQRAIKLDATFSNPVYGLYTVYSEMKHYGPAEAYYRWAKRLD